MESDTPPKPEIHDKHKRYASAYKPHDTYWGLGIECEAYIEVATTAHLQVPGVNFISHQAPERYSVRYYDSYKPNTYNEALKGIIDPSGTYTLPLLINAHSFQRTDASGEHTTAFKKRALPDGAGHVWDIIPNPKFNGTTILSALQAHTQYFDIPEDASGNPGVQAEKFIFDGDSIELATADFYKATIKSVCKEFSELRSEFVRELNAAWSGAGLPASYQPLKWMTTNHPWAALASNPRNISIFNNGTYHINLTLPTKLDKRGRISNWPAFLERHRRVARYIQWLQPFLLVAYGTPDPLAKSPLLGHRFSAASQRAAVSRYIGVGSYDTDKMLHGKLNTVPREATRVAKENGWMVMYERENAYKRLSEVGVDINFNKHYNHGLELRFFDYFEPERLSQLLRVIACVCDQAIQGPVSIPQESPLWNTLVEIVFQHGPAAKIYPWMCEKLSAALGLRVPPGPVLEVWDQIKYSLLARWADEGECAAAFLRGLGPAEHAAERSATAAAVPEFRMPSPPPSLIPSRLTSNTTPVIVTPKKSWLDKLLCR